MRRSLLLATLPLSIVAPALAAKVDLVGVFPGKAVVSVAGGAPRGLAVGDSVAGYRLVAVTDDAATFVVDGRRETVAMGSYVAGRADHGRAIAVLGADSSGHYLTQGTINGASARFLVDTGATMVMLSASEAARLHLAVASGAQGYANTANGRVAYRQVKLANVKVGDVELTNVDAGVLDGYDGPNLLGMSFLSRTEVSRDGANMVLTRRF